MQPLNVRQNLFRGELAVVAVFAVLLRVAVFAGAMCFGHLSLPQYTSKGDTASYLANAAAMCGERSRDSLGEYDQRVFPGYPALIAIVHRLGISLPMSALCVTWISAGVAAAAAGRVFEDARVGWAMICLIPHYLINASLGMSEAPLLAAVCLALLAWQTDRMILAGALFAFAGMIRPMACFACAGVLFAMQIGSTPVRRCSSARLLPQPKPNAPRRRESARQDAKNSNPILTILRLFLRAFASSRRMFLVRKSCQENKKSPDIREEPGSSVSDPALRRASEPACRAHMHAMLLLVASATFMFAIELTAFQLWTGDALRGIHVYSQNPGAYGGHLLAWPFHSLLTTPGIDGASAGRIVYIWIHVAVTLLACAMIANRIIPATKADWRDLISFPWLIGNTAFVLCIGSVWGFRHFPRFTIPAEPAVFWTLRKVLPRHAGWWMVIAGGCGVMAVFGVIDSP